MDDKVLKNLVQDELNWEPQVDAAEIGVAVSHGIVTLTGHVPYYSQKLAAENAVKRVKGVRGLAEELEVRVAAAPDSDEAIAARVAAMIEWDVTVPKGVVQVKVEDGVVTLSGEVNWQFQRINAEDGIRKLKGVRYVYNTIAVKAHPQPLDIKRRIEDALDRQAELDAKRISVIVDGDKVRLEGKVKAWFERQLVEQAAWAAPGVRSVDDRLSIAA